VGNCNYRYLMCERDGEEREEEEEEEREMVSVHSSNCGGSGGGEGTCPPLAPPTRPSPGTDWQCFSMPVCRGITFYSNTAKMVITITFDGVLVGYGYRSDISKCPYPDPYYS
jgi:hypothetical protein